MRSFRFLFVVSLFAVSVAACSGSNNLGGGSSRSTPLSSDTPATTPEPECPPGEIFFGLRCRQQRGIIIDQKKPPVLGIIIDQKPIYQKPNPEPPPPPPLPQPSN